MNFQDLIGLIENDDLAGLKRAEKSGANLEMRNPGDGSTLLMFAAAYGAEKTGLYLVKKYSTDAINAQNQLGETSLMHCFTHPNSQILFALYDRSDLDVDVLNNDGDSALKIGLLKKDKRLAPLIDRMSLAALMHRNGAEMSAIDLVVYHGALSCASRLIDRLPPEEFVQRKSRATSPLESALANHMSDIALDMIKKTPTKLLAGSAKGMSTFLLEAIRFGEEKAALAIIDKLSSRDLSRQIGHSPTFLMQAINAKLPKVALALIDKMSRKALAAQQADGRTALMDSLSEKMDIVSEVLIDILPQSNLGLVDRNGLGTVERAVSGTEEIATRLMDRMPSEFFSTPNRSVREALFRAIDYMKEPTAMRLVTRMSPEALALTKNGENEFVRFANKKITGANSMQFRPFVSDVIKRKLELRERVIETVDADKKSPAIALRPAARQHRYQ